MAEGQQVNGNGRSRIAEFLALGATLAAVLVPMGSAVLDLREDLKRVEEQAARARVDLEGRLRESIDNAEQRLQAAIDSHNAWALGRNSELDELTSELRERTRAVEAALVENETQHKWIADVFNALRAEVDQRTRAFWDGTRIVYPDEPDVLLESVGEARKNGNGHK